MRNNSQVLPARLRISGLTGWQGELFFLREESPTTGIFFVRPGKKFPLGTRVSCSTRSGHVIEGLVYHVFPGGERRLELTLPLPITGITQLLELEGETPYPPYMGEQRDTPDLRARYQTVYAQQPGSVAAPTAGLHFTERVLEGLAAKGIDTVNITLHVGAGTFLPVKVDDVREHRMHEEFFTIDEDAVGTLHRAWQDKRPLLAVGTTSLRTLEHVYRHQLTQAGTALSGSTDIFIHPPHKPDSATMLLTNFHLPESTLLMLVCAFAGDTDFVLKAYRTAVDKGYRFYSFGDAMLVLP